MSERVLEAPADDGYRLRYRAWQEGESDFLVVTLHGILTHSGWFSGLGETLAARGIHTIGHDRRGSGLNLEARGDVDGPERLLGDLGAVVAPHRERYAVVVYLGWCLGSTVALRYLLQRPDMGEGLILMSPDIYECHVTDEVQHRFASSQWDSRTTPRLRVPIPLEIYTDTPALDEFIRGDELKLKDFTPRLLRASFRLKEDLEASFAAFRKPSRLVLAGRDRIIDNARTEALYRRIGSADAGVVVLDTNHGIMFEALDALAGTVSDFAHRLRQPEPVA